jgi:hypothetical protein
MYLREIGWDVCGLHSSGSEQEKVKTVMTLDVPYNVRNILTN